MKKNFTTILLLCAFVSAFGQDITQTTAIHFEKKEEKNISSSIHPDLLFALYSFESEDKYELALSDISSLKLERKDIQASLKKRRRIGSGVRFFIGLAYGPETVISLFIPKMTLLYFQKTANKKLEFFYGGEFSIWIFNLFFGSLSATSGVKYGIFTLETNLSLFHAPKHQTNSGDILQRYTHAAFNPKAGIAIKNIWFRFGPSLILYKKYHAEEWSLIKPLRRGELRYNFEVVFFMAD